MDDLDYWESCAENLSWIKRWDKLLDWSLPHAKWFINGKINVSYNCLDRHVLAGLGDKVAIHWEGEPGDSLDISYQELYRNVNSFANLLKNLGVRKGDRVAIYLPMIPEVVYAMLACARIGAIHTVVFAGFGADSLKSRILDSGAKLLITADGGYRRGEVIELKQIADKALSEINLDKVLLIQRTKNDIDFVEGRDVWYHDAIKSTDIYCEPEEMDSEDVLFILYTSGTTGKPKGIVHTTGGYLTGVSSTSKIVFDLKDDDVFWCTADVGWITGHSYLVYGPLANAASVVMYEGAPDFPSKDILWKIVEKHKVSIFYTAPTLIRTLMKWGESWLEKYNLSSIRILGSVGEIINPRVWRWYQKNVGGGSCEVVDTWWQTETGCIMISPIPNETITKPGSATKTLPGISADVFNDEGLSDRKGYLCLTKPWPSMLRGIWNNDELFINTYWSKFEGFYYTGDGAEIDDDGYFWLLGRLDDVINVAGHNLSTMEIENALVSHESVAESAVVGVKDDMKGQAIVAFVILCNASDDLEHELKLHVSNNVGSIAKPKNIIFVDELPKTRSGKIMRRLLRDLYEGREVGDLSTLANSSLIENFQRILVSK